MQAETSPLSVLSLIVAPAVLTNASTVLAMSTSNRLARAVDRGRELAKQIEHAGDVDSAETERRMGELARTEVRSLMLSSALRSVYVALGCFACATIFALVSAVVGSLGAATFAWILALTGMLSGVVALGSIVHGALLLVRETRIVVDVLQERVASVRARTGTHRRGA